MFKNGHLIFNTLKSHLINAIWISRFAIENNSIKKKRKRPSSDLSHCIICQTSKNIELMCATAEGKESLWNAACIRKYVVYQRIVSEFNTTFLEAKREIFYHKNCIAPYRSQTNLSHKLGEQVAEKVGKTEIKNGVENEIDWKICIICQKQKNKSLRKKHIS